MKKLKFVGSFSILILTSLLFGCVKIPVLTPGTTETPFQSVNNPTHQPTVSQPPATLQPTKTESAVPVNATAFPNPDLYAWHLVQDGFNHPVGLINAGDGSGRVLIIEQAGVIRVLMRDRLLPTPFLDITDRVGSNGSEQGLLDLAFHPNFSQNGYFFVNYTDLNGNTVIARFTAQVNTTPENQAADPSSEFVLLRVEQPYANHNGGEMTFGPDGMLWMGLGDGGSAGDPHANGQSVQTLFGKILRIDVDHGNPYAIPPDNPYANGGGLPEIWGIGLRNPWRFSFDTATGDLYIGDVGQNLWEEIDYLPAGYKDIPANFGWSIREGLHPFKNTPNVTGAPLIDPIFEYGHDQGCSVTGGFVYRGKALSEFNGVYLFGDYCSGRVWGLIEAASNQPQGKLLFNTGLSISSFGVDDNGELYLLDLNGGVYRLQTK
jgi:glucose/arabinose dehydrogenase